MNEKDIITVAMKSCGWNQQVLAEKWKEKGYISRYVIAPDDVISEKIKK